MIYENTPTIETERLILRRFTQDDIGAFFLIMSDEETNTFLPWFTKKTPEEAMESLKKHFLDRYQDESAYRYAVCLKEDNVPIGYVGLNSGDGHDIGYGLIHKAWGKGIMTEAVAAVVDRIRKAGYSFITATHDINNKKSGEVMKKVGMSYKYSYVEQWQPKDISVTFRMYQLNLDGNSERVYNKYWDTSAKHFVEQDV